MNKLLAIVKREYIQRVRARMFNVTTVLLPVAMAMFGIAPALVLSIESGTPMRVVVLDGTKAGHSGVIFRLIEPQHG